MERDKRQDDELKAAQIKYLKTKTAFLRARMLWPLIVVALVAAVVVINIASGRIYKTPPAAKQIIRKPVHLRGLFCRRHEAAACA